MKSLGMDVMTVTKESLLLIGICTADLASTLLLLHGGGAMEGNPLMSFYLRYGIGTFVMVKLSLVFLPIFIAEWGKQYKPKFVRMMLRATIATYLGMYVLVFLTVNVSWISAVGAPMYLPAPTHVTTAR
jgi:hypothetical protein